ncbi:HAD family hydrolase [Brachybacterium halotolerans subsp. kimchii]|uniref:HAD family hydrolase n=1 Tax=Brachybacterium halotolerans TaxID=2795215 RepID=UPI001E31D9AE|nr:HAD family hydrolase [Brachybacterium halotolerans]UEJ84186.1 HAD family hydrolase [Brachybacterium halotolerans subsp. kimchii]
MQLLIDLDNTLIDRDGGFARWAEGFVEELGGEREDLDWLLTADAHGYAPRRVLADGLRERLSLSTDPEELVVQLMRGQLPYIEPYPGVVSQLQRLRGAGIPTVVVTNGRTEQQSRKLDLTGIGNLVDHVVISESVGVKKPTAAIFEAALERLGSAAEPGAVWMVGDHPEADIAGGRAAGFSTGWVRHGRSWDEQGRDWRPTVQAETTREVLQLIADDASGFRVASPAGE